MKTMVKIIKVMIISMGILSMISCEDKFAEAENEVIETSKTSELGGNNEPPEGGGSFY